MFLKLLRFISASHFLNATSSVHRSRQFQNVKQARQRADLVEQGSSGIKVNKMKCTDSESKVGWHRKNTERLLATAGRKNHIARAQLELNLAKTMWDS